MKINNEVTPEMAIGPQIRMKRKELKMTLKELAEKTGVSISFLSQVELDKCSTTLETLRKIADALAIHPSAFFQEDANHAEDEFPFIYKDLSDGVMGANFKPLHITLKPHEDRGNEIQHLGHEFIYVLKGEVIITLEGEVHHLKEGRTLFYDASKGHYWRNDSTEKCELLVISNA